MKEKFLLTCVALSSIVNALGQPTYCAGELLKVDLKNLDIETIAERIVGNSIQYGESGEESTIWFYADGRAEHKFKNSDKIYNRNWGVSGGRILVVRGDEKIVPVEGYNDRWGVKFWFEDLEALVFWTGGSHRKPITSTLAFENPSCSYCLKHLWKRE